MSYILDALKKAEAERNTGVLRSPHFPQSPSTTAAPAAQPPRRAPWPWIAATALALALISTVIGVAWLRPLPQPAAVVAATPMQAPLVQAPVQGRTADVARQETQAPRKGAQKNEKEDEQARPPAKAKVARTNGAKKAPPPAPAVASEAIVALRDLPDAIQKQLPALKVGGYIYSGNKAERSVLINGRLLAEGDEAAPGLILERMLPDGMVMRYKGYQYRMRY